MYKSGDIGRWTFDGKVQCLGRIDNQIKLHGLRIELGEIENTIESIPGVSSAIVNKIELEGKESLCAYYVSNDDTKDNKYIKDFLRKSLPYYMVPSYIIKLKEMPYTINRKIDRKALPLPDITQSKTIEKKSIDNSKLTSNEKKLLHIWKNLLNLDDISITDNFFDIGGDSIAAISMQIEAVKYGLNFEYSDIFNFPTIKNLANNLPKNVINKDIANYDYTKINQILARNTFENISTIKKAVFKNILLIGTTGYLGAHIIHEFLEKQNGDVYCLIRSKDNVNPVQRCKEKLNFYFGSRYFEKISSRLKIFEGDITKENFGLSLENHLNISKNIDVVINSGALVKHYGDKRAFENINILGTKNIVSFCEKESKRLLHISTTSVSGNGEKEEIIEETTENKNNKKIFLESNLYIGQNIQSIYAITKFEAEKIVLNSISNGLNAQILRIGNITNRYSDGVFQQNISENAFAQKIKSFIEIKAFPEYLLEHALELTPVDLCAEAIIKILENDSICNVFTLYNTKLLPIKLFLSTLNSLNIPILPVSNCEMAKIITKVLQDDSKKNILSGIIHDIDNNKNLIYTSNVRIDATFTEMYLNAIGFSWKSIDSEYIIKYMNYFKKINFINF